MNSWKVFAKIAAWRIYDQAEGWKVIRFLVNYGYTILILNWFAWPHVDCITFTDQHDLIHAKISIIIHKLFLRTVIGSTSDCSLSTIETSLNFFIVLEVVRSLKTLNYLSKHLRLPYELESRLNIKMLKNILKCPLMRVKHFVIAVLIDDYFISFSRFQSTDLRINWWSCKDVQAGTQLWNGPVNFLRRLNWIVVLFDVSDAVLHGLLDLCFGWDDRCIIWILEGWIDWFHWVYQRPVVFASLTFARETVSLWELLLTKCKRRTVEQGSIILKDLGTCGNRSRYYQCDLIVEWNCVDVWIARQAKHTISAVVSITNVHSYQCFRRRHQSVQRFIESAFDW